MCDLFLFITDSNVANYEDDTTLYVRNRNMNKITKNLLTTFEWFQTTFSKLHVMLIKDNKLKINVGGQTRMQ